jgi:hypothetical protein
MFDFFGRGAENRELLFVTQEARTGISFGGAFLRGEILRRTSEKKKIVNFK